jgi:hypothetical protein
MIDYILRKANFFYKFLKNVNLSEINTYMGKGEHNHKKEKKKPKQDKNQKKKKGGK